MVITFPILKNYTMFPSLIQGLYKKQTCTIHLSDSNKIFVVFN